LRFTNRWDRVLQAAATFAREDASLIKMWNATLGVTAVSLSFGGFLLPQACTNISSSLIQGCIGDPSTSSMTFAFNYLAFGQIFSLFQNVPAEDLQSECGAYCEGYMSFYWNVNETFTNSPFSPDPLMKTLTSPECPQGTSFLGTIFSFAASESGAGITDFVYLVATLVPPGPNTYSNITDLFDIIQSNDFDRFGALLASAYSLAQDYFITQEEVALTQPVVAVFGGAEDFALETPNGKAYFDALPPSSQGQFVFFKKASGAAGHGEIGGFDVAFPYYKAFLDKIAYSTVDINTSVPSANPKYLHSLTSR